VLQLNWKAAATVATGATALAGWLFTPAAPERAAATRSSASAQRLPVTASLQEEASRLARARPSSAYAQPERNPFRFPPAAVAPARRAVRAAETPAVASVVPPAPVFPFRLTGMASDASTGATVRTAVLSSAALGLVLARAGDVVADVYRVERIEDDAVEVVDLRDSRTIRLTLSR
jgi:hypothetical protein